MDLVCSRVLQQRRQAAGQALLLVARGDHDADREAGHGVCGPRGEGRPATAPAGQPRQGDGRGERLRDREGTPGHRARYVP
jgi:hypothetical protein